MKFCFSIAVFFIFGECGTDGFDPQCLALKYAYLKSLLMIWMNIEHEHPDQWIFSRELSEEFYSCLYISMCLKMIYCFVK